MVKTEEGKQGLYFDEEALKEQICYMREILNERQFRCYLGKTAIGIGWGGQAIVSKLSGASINTVRRGIADVKTGSDIGDRIRKTGAGRKSKLVEYPNLDEAIEEIIDGETYGDPQKMLHWTTSGLMDIQKALLEQYEIKVSHTLIAQHLDALGYSKQLNQKMLQVGKAHPDRDAQFKYIDATSKAYIAQGVPVISIDCKKKENIGNFKNNGQEYRKINDPRKVLDHDYLIKELGTVAPYGIYDIDKNMGFINLGTSHDTAEFAVNSIYQWWLHIGKETYPNAKKNYITCDGGGSNGSRLHLWKTQLAELSERLSLEIHVSHFPPGTSKWNKIEHRLFCFISKSWQGKPLIDIPTVINLIGSTETVTGLKVKCVLDVNKYQTGIKVPASLYDRVNIDRIEPLSDWNYIIRGFTH